MAAVNKLQAAIDHLGDYADNYITHWIDGDDAADQAAARKTTRQTEAAKKIVADALEAAKNMRVALDGIHRKLSNGDLTSDQVIHTIGVADAWARGAIAQAEEAGITVAD